MHTGDITRLLGKDGSSQQAGGFRRQPLIDVPGWEGKLSFRRAAEADIPRLKALYDSSWGAELGISPAQLRSEIGNFPEGQIVGSENGSGEPVSMINMLLSCYTPMGIRGGYAALTGNRTFSTHVPPGELAEMVEGRDDALAVAYCVSIAVAPEHARNGYAKETLDYAIAFARANGLIAVPYSAPRGFGSARKRCPSLGIRDYLHLTKSSGTDYESFRERTARMNALGRAGAAFAGGGGLIREPSRSIFEEYRDMGDDALDCPRGRTAFDRFMERDGGDLAGTYGRDMTVEDFCLLSGRRLMDPVMRMHVENGARFIRDREGRITAVFARSRPKDGAACGYNIALTYGYHRLFGHPWAD
jgi:GNAT superfamily N-acetyltransferase